MTGQTTLGRSATLAYGLAAYASFHACFLYLIFFLADAPLPYTVENGTQLPWAAALGLNLVLISLFAVQHTVMARPAFKQAWTRIVPEPIERSTFVVATVACLTVIMLFWAPIGGHLWHVQAPWVRTLLWCVQGAGWGTVVWSTFLIDHWELFGVRQVLCHYRGTPLPGKSFRTPSLYRFVRHPMMVGMLLALWSTPDMTYSRLVFSAGFTVYILLGVRIEERDLVAALGEDYRRYQQSVPRLMPRLTPRGEAPVRASESG
jgi:protein-S-isoprenylcysteine O-methyltransferase Ste14